jgi:hypothetical protein
MSTSSESEPALHQAEPERRPHFIREVLKVRSIDEVR